MNEILKPAMDYIKKKLGKVGLLAVSFFVLGITSVITIITQYEDYIVTPPALQRTADKLDSKTGFVELRLIRIEKSQFSKEQYDLEDIIYDLEKRHEAVKPRLTNRLNYVMTRQEELSKEEVALILYLKK